MCLDDCHRRQVTDWKADAGAALGCLDASFSPAEVPIYKQQSGWNGQISSSKCRSLKPHPGSTGIHVHSGHPKPSPWASPHWKPLQSNIKNDKTWTCQKDRENRRDLSTSSPRIQSEPAPLQTTWPTTWLCTLGFCKIECQSWTGWVSKSSVFKECFM